MIFLSHTPSHTYKGCVLSFSHHTPPLSGVYKPEYHKKIKFLFDHLMKFHGLIECKRIQKMSPYSPYKRKNFVDAPNVCKWLHTDNLFVPDQGGTPAYFFSNILGAPPCPLLMTSSTALRNHISSKKDLRRPFSEFNAKAIFDWPSLALL
jgi:hypothetical protein